MSLQAAPGPTSFQTKAGNYFIRRVARQDHPSTDWFAITVPPNGKLVYLMEVICIQNHFSKSVVRARQPDNLNNVLFWASNLFCSGQNSIVTTRAGDNGVILGVIRDHFVQAKFTDVEYLAKKTPEAISIVIFGEPDTVVATLVVDQEDERFVTTRVFEDLSLPEALFMTFCTKLLYVVLDKTPIYRCPQLRGYGLQYMVDNINRNTGAAVAQPRDWYTIIESYAGSKYLKLPEWQIQKTFSNEVYIRKIAAIQRFKNQAEYYILEDKGRQPLLVFLHDKENPIEVKALLPTSLQCVFQADNFSRIYESESPFCRVTMSNAEDPPVLGYVNDRVLYDSYNCVMGMYDHQKEPTLGDIGYTIMYVSRFTIGLAEMGISNDTGSLSGKLIFQFIDDIILKALCYIGLLGRVIKFQSSIHDVPLLGSHQDILTVLSNL